MNDKILFEITFPLEYRIINGDTSSIRDVLQGNYYSFKKIFNDDLKLDKDYSVKARYRRSYAEILKNKKIKLDSIITFNNIYLSMTLGTTKHIYCDATINN